MCRMLEDISRKFQFSETIRVLNKDFFEWTPAEVTSKKGLVVLNPPFGVRLKKDSVSGAYYNEIIAKFKSDYRGWRLALLLPEAYSAKGLPGNFSAFPLYHGGLKLSLLVGRLL